MKAHVFFHAVAAVLLHVFQLLQRGPDLPQLRGGGPFRGQRGRLRFDADTQLEHLLNRLLGRFGAGHDAKRRGGQRFRNEGAQTLPGRDQAIGFQARNPFAYDGAADAVFGGQLSFRGKAAARRAFAGLDLPGQYFAEFFRQVGVAQRRRHRRANVLWWRGGR